MNWTGILHYILSIMSLEYIINVFCDFLDEMVKKTSNKLDDKAVAIVKMILLSAFKEDHEQLSELTGVPGANGVPGKANSTI